MARLPWITLYSDIIYDHKIRRLTVEERWFWIFLLYLASESNARHTYPGRICVTDSIPFDLDDFVTLCGHSTLDQCSDGTNPKDMIKSALEKFERLEMMDRDNGIVFIKHYEKQQDSYLSDAERTSRDREKKARDSHVTSVTQPSKKVTQERDREGDKDKNISPSEMGAPPPAKKSHPRLEVFRKEYKLSTGHDYVIGNFNEHGGAAKSTVSLIPDESVCRQAVRAYLAARDKRIVEASFPYLWFIRDLNQWIGAAQEGGKHGTDSGFAEKNHTEGTW